MLVISATREADKIMNSRPAWAKVAVSKINTNKRTGIVAKVAKHSLSKCQALGSIPGTTRK